LRSNAAQSHDFLGYMRSTSVQTRRMAIANGTCVSFCNQPKAHYLAIPHESHADMSLPSDSSAVAGSAIWLRRESKVKFVLK